jgi:segregation and condensation protein B
MNLESIIESLLFIGAKPMSSAQLGDLAKCTVAEATEVADKLADYYRSAGRGMLVIKSSGKYQMVSAPENAEFVQGLVKAETSGELSRPSLETLTIIAYRGPIRKGDLDRVRGVNCSLILRNLMTRGLVESKQEADETFYSVTMDFVRYLGISDLKELPDYDKLSVDSFFDEALQRD